MLHSYSYTLPRKTFIYYMMDSYEVRELESCKKLPHTLVPDTKRHRVRLKSDKCSTWERMQSVLMFSVIITIITSAYSNKPPRFVTDGQSEIVLRLKESPETQVGNLIYTLKGYDPDNDTLTFDKRATADSGVIRIENNGTTEALVYLAKELDRETQDEYSIVLTLSDNHFNDYNYVTQSFLLLVEDINDNSPVFLPYQSTIEVPEDSQPDILTALEAVDADEGAYGQVVYYLQELEGDNDVFAISTYQGKGILRLTGALDYESKSLYQLRILAIDRANYGPVNTGTAAILIKIKDIEDQPPEFVKVQPVARIPEDAAVGTKVMRVLCIDGDRGINNPIVYELEDNELFAIERYTGWIYTTQLLDRENINNQVDGAYILKITASELIKGHEFSGVTGTTFPPQLPSSQVRTEVTVIISDVNDEIPTFGQSFYRCEINENSQANTPLNFLDAEVKNFIHDHDVGNNGTFRLFLDPQNDLFEIVPAVAVNEANFMLRVKNSKALDFEIMKEINFTLFAREMDEPTRYSSAHVQITIRDQNDNFPEFSHAIYSVSLMENSEIGTAITKIQATDKDSQDFGTCGIRYRHLRGGVAHLLHLDPITGVITVKKAGGSAFDREFMSQHYLTVEAIDNLGNGNRNTAQLIINIEDVNDNAPIFLHRQYETTLFENKRDFEHPLQLESRDIDLNDTENSQITYEIVEGMYMSHFYIDPVKGSIKLLKAFDYEELVEHKSRQGRLMGEGLLETHLLVRARDSGIPMLSTVVPVMIYVKDINDNPPIFQKKFYSRSIVEDLPSGSSILQVSAIDRDGSAPNNVIVYRIQAGAGDKFVINSETGVLSVAHGASLDPDLTEAKTTHYTITVLAIDGGIGNSQLMNSATINITIKDVNNKVPVLGELPLLRTGENVAVGTELYRIQAHDLDENPILRYKINARNSEARNEDGIFIQQSEYDYVSAFDLDPINGRLQTAKLIDREKVEHIKLAIMVEDLAAANGQQLAEGILSLHILDENDNNPKFKEPFYKRSIAENSKNGVQIAQLNAYDNDKNRTITYSLEGNPLITQLVHLNAQSGELVVGSKIDHEQFQWLNFSIRATDSGLPPRSTLVDIYVTVLDENDNNPYFLSGSKNYTISESANIGTRVGTVYAGDSDSGDFGKITFLLDRISSQGKFSIDADTGVLSVVDKLDRETKDFYMLVIEAWDNYQFGFSAGESRNAFKQVFVTILDENDNAPQIDKDFSECVFITEYHELNEKIVTIKGSDNDDPQTPNGRLEFHIAKGNTEELFELRQIDAWTADIYARFSLRNRYGNHSMLIRIHDLGVPSNYISKTLDICISDYNDHAPTFVQPLRNSTVRIPENITIGSLVLQVLATDDDIGLNALIKYRLKPDPLGSYKLFELDSETGNLYIKQPLDRNKQKIHEIRIEAYDQGLPTSLTTDLDLIVYVRKVNEYEPQFIVDEIYVNFTEHTDPGVERVELPTTIDKDEADDLDDPPSHVCYSIIYGNEEEYFHLDPETHILVTTKELDRELQSNYSLYVKASTSCTSGENILKNKQNKIEIEIDQKSEKTHYRTQQASVYKPEIYNRYKHSRTIRSLRDEEAAAFNNASVRELFKADSTVVKVEIHVADINDNPPKFQSKIFTGGITTNADFGARFMRVEATDLDEGENAKITYYQVGEIRQTLSEGLENVKTSPFLVDRETGEIQLNFDPQKDMKGYFDFMVLANDSVGMKDVARVFIYLLREDQKVRFVFRLQTDELRDRVHEFKETLSNITAAIVNIDEIKVHENRDGSVDKTKTDLYMHLVSKMDNSIYEVAEVLNLIDGHIESLDKLFKDLNVLDTQAAEAQLLTSELQANAMFVWLVFTNLFLATLLVVILILCISQRTDYKRQLRAAEVNIFRNSSLSLRNTAETITRVPNTNKHSLQGSNPMWLKGYENEWFKTEENLSRSDRDSLDDNFLAIANQDNGCASAKLFQQTNDLNRHFNVCNHIDKLTNNAHLLAKKLETTEL
uniref:Cadherin domain-containing protein n=1 Tax=Glossina palpalis gambiensis TaxID=67801 RepID=A0A1B0B4Y0_9MUSC